MIWHLLIYLLAATIDPSFMDIFIDFYKYSDIYRYINCFFKVIWHLYIYLSAFINDLAFMDIFLGFYK